MPSIVMYFLRHLSVLDIVTEFEKLQLHRLRLLRMTWGISPCWVLTLIKQGIQVLQCLPYSEQLVMLADPLGRDRKKLSFTG